AGSHIETAESGLWYACCQAVAHTTERRHRAVTYEVRPEVSRDVPTLLHHRRRRARRPAPGAPRRRLPDTGAAPGRWRDRVWRHRVRCRPASRLDRAAVAGALSRRAPGRRPILRL